MGKVADGPVSTLVDNQGWQQAVMDYILLVFKAVSVTFACFAVATGAHALWSPTGFAASFGIPVQPLPNVNVLNGSNQSEEDRATSYVRLLGARQLASGMILLALAGLGEWTEMAVVLSTLGLVVATTDGLILNRSGAGTKGLFHALPGVVMATLSGVFFCITR